MRDGWRGKGRGWEGGEARREGEGGREGGGKEREAGLNVGVALGAWIHRCLVFNYKRPFVLSMYIYPGSVTQWHCAVPLSWGRGHAGFTRRMCRAWLTLTIEGIKELCPHSY